MTAILHRTKCDANRRRIHRVAWRQLAFCLPDLNTKHLIDSGSNIRVENSGGIRASLAGRYASALFALAEEQKSIESVGASLDKLDAALGESAELRAVLTSPVLSRDAAGGAIAATADALGVDTLTKNMLGVLAANRRLEQLPNVIAAFRMLAARHRGEITAEVTSAHPLTDEQLDALKSQLRTRVGRDVAVTTTVDPAILGGLVVKLGSQMIDSSIRTKLNAVGQAMKGLS